MKFQTLLYILIAALCVNCHTTAQNWETLFDGTSIDQWEIQGGKATYEIKDKSIVGTAVLNSPNTFLCTKKNYTDFILELEVFLPNPLNSGIQFRSQVNEEGRVSGYQCEIDPGERKFTGGIYDESRRGWLYPLSRNQGAQEAFKMGEWNTIRIECLSNDLRTYVNGKLCSYLIDQESVNGFIGLQVHGIRKKEESGYQVKWRNIKILTQNVAAHRIPIDEEVAQVVFVPNAITVTEKKQGWQSLFDGQSLNGWRSIRKDQKIENWTVKNGQLTLDPAIEGGDIVTEKSYKNFELQLEFKIAKGGNSGIKYFIDSGKKKELSQIGCEFQILDDRRHPDAKDGRNGNRTVASLYDLIPADNVTTPGRGKQFKGVNRWNHARIVVNNGLVQHWLNNELALEYDRFSHAFKALVDESKFVGRTDFGQATKGRILLQDHNDVVSFRSIKIRSL